MTELVSLMLALRPAQPVTLPAHLGRAAHALLLRWLDEADPALAQRWHDADGPKPFTCSSLMGAGRMQADRQRALTPDQTYWLRLTSFDPTVSARLLAVRDDPPPAVELDGVALLVTGATTDPAVHPWAGVSTYEQLAAPYLLARQPGPRRLTLSFASPTTFRQREMNMPLPLPELVFGGLVERWNAFSPVTISPEVRRYAAECVAISQFELRSRSVPLKDGGLQVGVTGRARYVAVTYDRYWTNLLGLLADFAFFAGVGRLTTVGLGQCRRLAN
ncbi:MAG: CRISPR-associated endoribonuclease Cas6 [Anaerolineae bacterium]